MSIISPLGGRVIMGITFIATGFTFIYVGGAFVLFGEAFGIGLMLVGLVPVIFAPIYIWRGGRLGAEISSSELIVHSYFKDMIVPLANLSRVYRGIDGTGFEFSDGRQFFLDDCYFPDQAARDRFLNSVTAQTTHPVHDQNLSG